MDKLKEEVLPEIDLLIFLESFIGHFQLSVLEKDFSISVDLGDAEDCKTSTGFDVTIKFGNHIQDFLFLHVYQISLMQV